MDRAETRARCLRSFAPKPEMTTARAAAIVLAKELRMEFRARELLSATVVFALVVVVLFSFAFDPTAGDSRRFGPGLLWIAFLFAGSLMLNPSFAREQSNQTLDALRMAPVSPFAILLGKMLANFIFMSISEAILVPVFAVLYNISIAGIVGRLSARPGAGHDRAGGHRHRVFGCRRARADARTAAAAALASDSCAASDCGCGGDSLAIRRTARARPRVARIPRWI